MIAKLEKKTEVMHPSEFKVTRKKRVRHDIVMEILKSSRTRTRKTKIMENVGLSYPQLKKYLSSLEKAGFITEESGWWKTTERGLNVIEACRICQSLVGEIP